jgi:hypothetical protein
MAGTPIFFDGSKALEFDPTIFTSRPACLN